MAEPSPFSTALRHKRYQPLSREEEAVVMARLVQGDPRAADLLVQHNLKFVASVARNYQGRGLELGELISEGAIGLRLAAAKFDPGKNLRFISYAVWWIRQRMIMALAAQSGSMPIPPRFLDMARKIEKTRRRLEHQLCRPATLPELAGAMDVSLGTLTDCLQVLTPALSLSNPVGASDGDGSLEDLLAGVDDAGQAADAYLLSRHQERILEPLTELDREIMVRCHGLDGEEPETLDDIGQRYGLSRERIRQRRDKAKERCQRRVKELAGGRG